MDTDLMLTLAQQAGLVKVAEAIEAVYCTGCGAPWCAACPAGDVLGALDEERFEPFAPRTALAVVQAALNV